MAKGSEKNADRHRNFIRQQRVLCLFPSEGVGGLECGVSKRYYVG